MDHSTILAVHKNSIHIFMIRDGGGYKGLGINVGNVA